MVILEWAEGLQATYDHEADRLTKPLNPGVPSIWL